MIYQNKKFILGITTLAVIAFLPTSIIFAAGENCAKAGGSCAAISAESGSTCGDDDYGGPMDCPSGQGCCIPKGVNNTANTTPSTTTPSPASTNSNASTTTPNSQNTNTSSTQSAANNPEPGNPNAAPTPAQAQALGLTADTSNSLVPCTNGCTLCDIIVGLNRIFKYLGTLLVIATTLFIVIAGIAYMVSGGSKNLMEWAKKALMYALIGFALYLASWLIVGSILSAMGYNRTSWSTFNCQSGS